MKRALWIVQWLLAALFLFAGVAKLVMPLEDVARQMSLSVSLLRFVAVAEVLGALGLVLPGLLKIRPGLVPLAALGLLIIMVGATVLSWNGGGAKMAALPFITGLLLIFVIYGKTRTH